MDLSIPEAEIIGIQETHMTNNTDNQPYLEGFQWYGHCRSVRHIRSNKTYGGVGIFVKNSLLQSFNVSVLDNSFEGILCLLFKDKISDFCFSVYCCYLPPENSPYGRDCTSFFTHLLSLIYLHNYVDCYFVLGDLNSRVGNKLDAISLIDDVPERECIDTACNSHGEAFIDFLHESRMLITNGRVTGSNTFTSISPRGSSVVDYFAVPHDNFNNCISLNVKPITEVISNHCLESMLSERCRAPDHSLISLTYKITSMDSFRSDESDEQNQPSENTNKRYNYGTMSDSFMKSPSWLSILDTLIARLEADEKSQSSIDSFYDDMLNEIFTEMDGHIMYKDASKNSKKHFKNHKPFWTNELTISWKKMAQAEKEYLKFKNTSRKQSLHTEFVTKRKLFDKLLRKTERCYYRKKAIEIEQVNTSNPTEFWKCIKKLGPMKKSKIPMQVYDANSTDPHLKVSDPDAVMNQWKDDFYGLYNIPIDNNQNSEFDDEFYTSISTVLPGIKAYERDNTEANSQYAYNAPFLIDELDKVCRLLKTSKAAGPDMIPNEVLKHEGIRIMLLEFVNICFVNNVLPSAWRTAIITPIPKSASKDPCVPLNYRGISLLSCLYKLYTSLLNQRLSLHCESNDYLVDEQNGFRSARSCQDHIYVLSSVIKNRKSNGEDTFCAFVDFKKAFDWVPRDLLLYKLSNSFDIHGRLFNTLATIYSSSVAQIRINGMLTEPFDVTSGVKQGDIISPLLFSMYLNDLATGIKNLNCGLDINDYNLSILLYADDIVLIAPSERALQKMLSYIHKWCKKWRMAINTDKTQVVHFRRQKSARTNHNFSLGNDDLDIVSFYKYLGVTFDEYLNFDQNSVILAGAAGRALGLIRTKLKNLKFSGYKTFNSLFQSGVLSIADYSAGIWGTKVFPKTEQVQYKGARYFLGVHQFASTNCLLGDMGWVSANTRHKLLILKYWNRLCEMNEFRVTKKIFIWDISHSHRKGTWSYCVKNILSDIGCEDLFQNTQPCDTKFAKHIIYEKDQMDWDIKRYKSEKLRYYNLYKFDKSIEDYLLLNLSRYQRSIFAQFRHGILPLEIEVGRYRNAPLQDRICQLCSTAVEDEIHFLCDCPAYACKRENLYDKAKELEPSFNDMDSIDKFVFLMSNLQKPVIYYLIDALAIRTNCLTRNLVN